MLIGVGAFGCEKLVLILSCSTRDGKGMILWRHLASADTRTPQGLPHKLSWEGSEVERRVGRSQDIAIVQPVGSRPPPEGCTICRCALSFTEITDHRSAITSSV
jgi:hypothetical protein